MPPIPARPAPPAPPPNKAANGFAAGAEDWVDEDGVVVVLDPDVAVVEDGGASPAAVEVVLDVVAVDAALLVVVPELDKPPNMPGMPSKLANGLAAPVAEFVVDEAEPVTTPQKIQG